MTHTSSRPGTSTEPRGGELRAGEPRRASGMIASVSPSRDEDTTQTPLEAPHRTPAQGVPRNRPRLVMLQGTSVGAMHRVADGTVIGRQGDVAVQIESAEVSRRHARLFVVKGGFFVEDLGSRNGTYLNGMRVDAPTALVDGDKLEVGGNVLRFALFDQIDEEYQSQIYESSLRDGLTRAFNRKYFDERLDSEVAYSLRHDTPLSLLVFDVDHFKSVNDSWGHQVGDAVLVQLVQHVLRVIRAEDVLARYGGEEFVVLSRGIKLPEAVAFGERLRSAIERQAFAHGTQRVPVTVSIGVASMPAENIHQASHLFDRADRALYIAKERGRNRVETA
jgi:two-component system cell cycle response regulator